MTTPDQISLALDRLGPNIALLRGAVSGLELVLRRAEEIEDESVKAALPFLGLIWLYSAAMRDILDARREDGTMLWNAPALAVLTRPLQEAFLSMVYFVIEKPSPVEAEFRQLLLSRHVAYKRWDLLKRADHSNKDIAEECGAAFADWNAANQFVLNHPHMKTVAPGVSKRITKDGDCYIADPLDAVWARAGLPHELYDVLFRYLSQYAHATPYAVANLRFHQADHEDGAVNMAVPTQLATVCIVHALSYAASIHPELDKLIPAAFREFESK